MPGSRGEEIGGLAGIEWVGRGARRPRVGGWRAGDGRSYVPGMKDRELYRRILGLEAPWKVTHVEVNEKEKEVRVHVSQGEISPPCPECGRKCVRYDHRVREWRHLDTCQFKTILVAEVPRVDCPEHGVHTIRVPWSEPGSRFTALFEALVISWLQETSAAAVARLVDLSWDQVAGIMDRAVRRGLSRRKSTAAKCIGVDETSFQKRHEYVTVVADLLADEPKVLYVADHHRQGSLAGYYDTLGYAKYVAVSGN